VSVQGAAGTFSKFQANKSGTAGGSKHVPGTARAVRRQVREGSAQIHLPQGRNDPVVMLYGASRGWVCVRSAQHGDVRQVDAPGRQRVSALARAPVRLRLARELTESNQSGVECARPTDPFLDPHGAPIWPVAVPPSARAARPANARDRHFAPIDALLAARARPIWARPTHSGIRCHPPTPHRVLVFCVACGAWPWMGNMNYPLGRRARARRDPVKDARATTPVRGVGPERRLRV